MVGPEVAAALEGGEMEFDEVGTWLERILETLTGSAPVSIALTAVIILGITAVIGWLVTRLIRHILAKELLHVANTSIIVNIFRVVVWGAGISIVLSSCFNVNVTALMAALGVGGVALSLGLQDTIANLIGGIQVSILSIIKPGDYISVGGNTGIVQDVTWRHTTIRDFGGSTYVIPNKSINTSAVTVLPPSRKIKVKVCFTNNPGKDLEELKKHMLVAVKNEVAKVAHVDKDPIFRFSAITEYCFEGTVIIWVSSQPTFDIYDVQDAIVRASAPYSRAEGMRPDLKARALNKGIVAPVEGFVERVDADVSMADELLTEEDFMK